jgi:hypothetical protein
MQEIHLSDQVYAEVQRLAKARGYATADEYVADLLSLRITEEAGDFDHRFTPDVVDHIRRAAARADEAEGTLTKGELDARLESARATWRKERAG